MTMVLPPNIRLARKASISRLICIFCDLRVLFQGLTTLYHNVFRNTIRNYHNILGPALRRPRHHKPASRSPGEGACAGSGTTRRAGKGNPLRCQSNGVVTSPQPTTSLQGRVSNAPFFTCTLRCTRLPLCHPSSQFSCPQHKYDRNKRCLLHRLVAQHAQHEK